jgi:hypothetical protein
MKFDKFVYGAKIAMVYALVILNGWGLFISIESEPTRPDVSWIVQLSFIFSSILFCLYSVNVSNKSSQ